jgi:metallo-beta-lactamase family protein
MGNTWNFREIAGDNQQTHTFSQQSRFDFENLRIVRFHKQSLALGRQRKAVILAGSGMAEGGRILNHLAMNIADHNNTVMFVGYQADGTLGRKIVDGNKVIKINNKKFDVRARIEYLQGFSAHADQPTLIEWLGAAKKDKLKNVFLVHADPDRSEAFKSAISNNGYEVTIPDWKQNFQI